MESDLAELVLSGVDVTAQRLSDILINWEHTRVATQLAELRQFYRPQENVVDMISRAYEFFDLEPSTAIANKRVFQEAALCSLEEPRLLKNSSLAVEGLIAFELGLGLHYVALRITSLLNSGAIAAVDERRKFAGVKSEALQSQILRHLKTVGYSQSIQRAAAQAVLKYASVTPEIVPRCIKLVFNDVQADFLKNLEVSLESFDYFLNYAVSASLGKQAGLKRLGEAMKPAMDDLDYETRKRAVALLGPQMAGILATREYYFYPQSAALDNDNRQGDQNLVVFEPVTVQELRAPEKIVH